MRVAGKSLFDFTRLVRSAMILDQYGTSFPVVGQKGFRFYRTDLEEWFERQPLWGGWLGDTRTYLRAFSGDELSASGYAEFAAGGPTYSATLGLVAPYRMKIVRVSVTTPGATGCRWQINGSGTLIGGAVYDMSEAETVTFHEGLNGGTAAAEGAILAPYLNLGTASGGYFFEAELRRLALDSE